jgi:hypothetical protein
MLPGQRHPGPGLRFFPQTTSAVDIPQAGVDGLVVVDPATASAFANAGDTAADASSAVGSAASEGLGASGSTSAGASVSGSAASSEGLAASGTTTAAAAIGGSAAVADGLQLAGIVAGSAVTSGTYADAIGAAQAATAGGGGSVSGNAAAAREVASFGSLTANASTTVEAASSASRAVPPDNVIGGPLDVTISGGSAIAISPTPAPTISGEVLEFVHPGGPIVINVERRKKKPAPLPYTKEPAIDAIIGGSERVGLSFATRGTIAAAAGAATTHAIVSAFGEQAKATAAAVATVSPAPARCIACGGSIHGEQLRADRIEPQITALRLDLRTPRIAKSLGGINALHIDLEKKRNIKLSRPALVARRLQPLKKKIAKFLDREGRAIAKDIARQYGELTKAAGDDVVIKIDWSGLVGDVQSNLDSIFQAGGRRAFADVGGDGPFDQLNELAQAYAQKRAAAMVGMKWKGDELVPNPNAKFAITETTRDDLRSLVDRAFEEGLTPKELQQRIEDLGAFSESRAEMIARTELAKAQSEGSLLGWKESGVVSGKRWLLSNEHGPADECDDNADVGVIDIDESFPSGDDTAPAHPHCYCDVVAEIDEQLDAA